MTESEWLACADPSAMIDLLRSEQSVFRSRWLGWLTHPKFQISERKWKLFYCAVVRRIEHLLPVEESRQLIDVVEALADEKATEDQLLTAIAASMSAYDTDRRSQIGSGGYLSESCHWVFQVISRFHRTEEAGRRPALRHAACAWGAAPYTQTNPEWETQVQMETARQAELLRDVIGNPFHRSVVDPAWLAWNGATVQRVATGIYQNKSWDELPILADALEDADCNDPAILTHCRSGGLHTRGCWVVDLLLGKS